MDNLMEYNKDNKIGTHDFESICRICCTIQLELVDIFKNELDGKIMEIAHIKVSKGDNLPKRICQVCQKLIEESYKLLNLIKSSDSFFHLILESTKPETVGEKSKNREKIDGPKKPGRRKKRRRTAVYSKSRKSKRGASTLRNKSDESEKVYIVIVPEKSTDDDDRTSIMNSVLKSDHTYPCNFESSNIKEENLNFDIVNSAQIENLLAEVKEEPVENLSDNLLEFVRNFGKDGLSDTDDPMEVNNITPSQDMALPCVVFKINLGDYVCNLCQDKFETYKNYADHLELKHSWNILSIPKFSMEYMCPVCQKDRFLSKRTFFEHLGSYKKEHVCFVKVDGAGEPIPLGENESVFTSYDTAIKIIESNHESVLSKHGKDDDNNKTPQYTDKKSIMIPSDDSENKIYRVIEPLACGECCFQADTETILETHYCSVHNQSVSLEYKFICPVCNLSVDFTNTESRSNFYAHLQAHKEDKFKFIKVNSKNYILELNESDLTTFLLLKDTSSSNSPTGEKFFNLPSVSNYEAEKKDATAMFRDYPTHKPTVIVHSDTRSRGKIYACDICSKVFKRKLSIIFHLQAHETGAETFCCEKCGKVYNCKSKYNKHFKCHDPLLTKINSKKRKCTICSKIFINSATLQRHILCHMEEAGKNVEYLQDLSLSCICEICGKGFASNAYLNKHKTQHLIKNNVKKCIICDKEFTKTGAYNKHIAAHLNPSCVECNVCKFPLLTQHSLERHAQLHNDGSSTTYDCAACNVSFLTKESLIAHQGQLGHNKEALHCNVCPEVFFSGKEFYQHIKTHPKYKLSECNLCGKRLSTAQSLMLHVARHFESSGILCPHCGKKFYEKKNFDRHLLTHDGIKPFTCDVENCPKSFYTMFELKRHKKYHDNKRDFNCQFCSKSFHEANHLKVHVRSHTGERPYVCPHCKKGFVTRTRCKQHIKLVHKGIGYDLILSKISKKVTVFEPVDVSCL